MGYIYELIDSNRGGGSGQMESAANFSALPPASEETGFSWFVENSQGTAWLPGSLGGTYYPRGVYYSNGTIWLYQENPGQATQGEANAGLVTDKFMTPETTANLSKWATKENVLTAGSGITINRTNPLAPIISANGGGGGEVIINTNTAPTVTDDANAGNFVGQRWIDNSKTPRWIYVCKDDTAGAAVWEVINNPIEEKHNNVQVVKTLADFPAPVGNEIPLEDKTYSIDALKLDMTGYTLLYSTRSAIQGYNQNVSSLQWKGNGDLCFKSTTNLFINDIEVYMSAPNQTLFDHRGDGTTPEGESFEINRMAVYCQDDAGVFQSGCSAGIIKDIRQGFMGTQFFLGFQDGFKFAGAWTGGMRIVSTLWAAFGWGGASGKVYYSDPLDPVSFALRFFSDSAMTINGSNIGYDFPETAFIFDGQYQLQGGNVSGSGTYVTNFSGGIFPANDPKGNFKNNSGIKNTFPGLEWISDTDNIVIINAVNVWEKVIIASATVKDPTWVSYLNGEVTYNSDNALDGSVITRISATGKSGDIVQIKIVKEDALAVQTDLITATITIQGTTAQGRAENITIPTTTQVNKSDKLSVWIRNTSGTQDVTILSGANFILGQK